MVVSFFFFWTWPKCSFCHFTHFAPATLDSAVTIGKFGAKNFLMRDGKDAVPCVYYENVSTVSSGAEHPHPLSYCGPYHFSCAVENINHIRNDRESERTGSGATVLNDVLDGVYDQGWTTSIVFTLIVSALFFFLFFFYRMLFRFLPLPRAAINQCGIGTVVF